MKIAEWLERHPVEGVTVGPEASLEDAARVLLAEPECRDIYVIDTGGRVVGHLGFRRLAGVLLSAHRPTHSRRQIIDRVAGGPVREYMDRRFLAASPDENVHHVLHAHMERRVEDIPVVDDDRRLLGVIRLRDLVAAALAE
jgi:CBS domain-containing protein